VSGLVRSRNSKGLSKINEQGEKKMKTVSCIIGAAGDINLVIDNESHTVGVDHANYAEIIECLNAEKYDDIVRLMDIASTITIASEGKVTVLDGCVCYDGNEVINPLTDRILRFVKEGLPFKPMIRFLENLMENPSRTSIQELYLFLEVNTLPITEDGYFLAYKKVGNDYMDFYTKKIKNEVGDKPEVNRNEVDDVRDNVCSNGLHFCSMAYLPKYHGGDGRVMIVKINPANVVSIPSDYNNAKGRTCKYEVIGEHTDPKKEYVPYSESAVVAADGSELDIGAVVLENKCPDCGEYTEDCTCDETCGDCGNIWDDCICNDCPDCGEHIDECVCDTEEAPAINLGVKPDGKRFHNIRDAFGRFLKRS
jgi:hypothetical protein